MKLTDGSGYISHIPDFETIVKELELKYLKTRRCNPMTGEVKPKHKKEFERELVKKVEGMFRWQEMSYSMALTKLDLGDIGEINERYRAYKAEAARIKDSEYTAKIKSRASA